MHADTNQITVIESLQQAPYIVHEIEFLINTKDINKIHELKYSIKLNWNRKR